MQLKPIESKFKTSGPFLHQRDAKGRIAELESRERELLAELRKTKSADAKSTPQAEPTLASRSKIKLAAAKADNRSSAPTNSEKQAAAIVAEFEAMSPGPARSRFYKANRDLLRP